MASDTETDETGRGDECEEDAIGKCKLCCNENVIDLDEDNFPFPSDQKSYDEEDQKEWKFTLLKQIRQDPKMNSPYFNTQCKYLYIYGLY